MTQYTCLLNNLTWHWMLLSWSACPSSSTNNIRYTPCLCLHMQQADREWLIRALCWTQARCSAEAVTYFIPSLSDSHTQASTKGQESRGEVCSLCRILKHMHSTEAEFNAAALLTCLSLQATSTLSLLHDWKTYKNFMATSKEDSKMGALSGFPLFA